MSDPLFDAHARSYDQDLEKALSVSGEDKHYFAEGRIRWLARWLSRTSIPSGAVLDFGCGTGTAIPFLKSLLNPARILGVDPSTKSLEIATSTHRMAGTGFEPPNMPHGGEFDVAYCNGVFHHIPAQERQEALAYVFESLKPGGIFALFENNPWNPATLYVMSRCAFDHDAVTLSPNETSRRMRAAGFQVLTTRFLFIFPAILKWLRPLEQPLSPLPLGTQYVVVGRKP